MSRRGRDDRARYDPAKVRERAEKALGWEPGSSRDLSFRMLLEALKAKPDAWKARKDIEDMLRTGDHLLGPAVTESQLFVSPSAAALRAHYEPVELLLDRALRRSREGTESQLSVLRRTPSHASPEDSCDCPDCSIDVVESVLRRAGEPTH